MLRNKCYSSSRLLNSLYQQKQQMIGMWIIGFGNNRTEGVPGMLPLPDIDDRSSVQDIPGVAMRGSGGGDVNM